MREKIRSFSPEEETVRREGEKEVTRWKVKKKKRNVFWGADRKVSEV